MLTIENMPVEANSDAELVAGSLAGDRNAFGQIVHRYQALVCSIAYSATGCLAQSEDLAQEAFLRAWKELPTLREPAKLRPWLCRIVRYLIGKGCRRDEREPLRRAEPLEAAPESRTLEPSPPDRAISREEEAILWRSLERIPLTYREPLVLFYREHHSVASVARALDLSEDAVKQRLSRGRRLLQAEVSAFVEGTLERTSPGQSFTVGVLAAIPFLAPSAEAATAGGVAVAGKASGTLKGAGILGAAGLAVAAVTGQIAAIWGGIQSGHSARERRFLARTGWGGALAWKVLLLVVILFVASFSGNAVVINDLDDAGRWILVWLLLLALWVSYSIWVGRKRSQIELEQDTLSTADAGTGTASARRTGQGQAARAYGGLASWIFGPGGLLILLLHRQGNRLVSGAFLIMAIVTWLAGARIIMRRPEWTRRVFCSVRCGLALVTLTTLNVLWDSWVSHPEELWTGHAHGFHPAQLVLNLLIIVFYGSIELASWLVWRFATTARRRD